MAETISLTNPIPKPATNAVHLQQVVINIDAQSVYLQWLGDDGQTFSANYPTPSPNAQPTGATLINTLNTANFSSTSLVKRIYQRLQTDGYIPAGTIAGTPS